MKKTFASLALIACLTASPLALAHENNAAMSQSSPQAKEQPFDIQYLDTMVRHHEMGIKMMQMAVNKAQSQDVKAEAQKMMDDQKKEIPELKSMRNEVKADAPEAVNMDMPGMEPMDDSKLEQASGAEFDRMFLDMTIKHHQGAVKMSDAALEKAQNADVKNKAQTIHDKQKAEISKMEKMKEKLGG